MTPEQALNNLEEATAQLNCNRQVQLALIESIRVLSEAIKLKE